MDKTELGFRSLRVGTKNRSWIHILSKRCLQSLASERTGRSIPYVVPGKFWFHFGKLWSRQWLNFRHSWFCWKRFLVFLQRLRIKLECWIRWWTWKSISLQLNLLQCSLHRWVWLIRPKKVFFQWTKRCCENYTSSPRRC